MEAEGGAGGGSPALSPEGLLRRRRSSVNHAPQRVNVAASTNRLLESLQKALAANLSFQAAALAEIARINERKAKNRATTVALQRKLSQRRRIECRLVNRPQEGLHASVVETHALTAPFFSDSNGGDMPEPNPDAVRRLSLEKSALRASQHPPWSSQESKALKQIIQHHHHHSPNQPINYEQVAQQLAPSISFGKQSNQGMPQEELHLSSLVVPRTARECELHHTRCLHRPAAWTKAESTKLAELAHGRLSSWPDVVSDFNEHFHSSRTAWECFLHHQTKLQPPKLHWSLPQDQLLLRYVAAMGPQCVWNSPNCDAATRLSTSLLEDKTRQQILHRLHLSLCNPKLSNDPWTADEERKLVICLKIYHDSFAASGITAANDDAAQFASAGVSKALNLIADHHFSNRSSKAVVDKWKKSLDPGHSSLPFTDQEDARLVEIVSSLPELGWADLCRQYFPTRHPERVAKRWAEVATNQQIVNRERMVPTNGGDASVAVAVPKRGGRRRPRGQAAPPPGDEAEGAIQDDMFTTDDSSIRIRRAKLN